jgi:apolipoprotein N-acyltransferase
VAVRARRPAAALRRPALAAGLLAAGVLAVTATSVPGEPPDLAHPQLSPSATVGIVQGEVPGDGTDVASNHREVTRTLLRETRRLSRRLDGTEPLPALVVWPENATAVDPATDATARQALLAAVDAVRAPVLAGSITAGPTSSTARNQGIVWTPDGPRDRYTKQHLVPFGEYVPLRPLATRLSDRVAGIGRDMVPGSGAVPLRIGDLSVADALCFDVAHDDVLREQVADGADLAVVQTSNAMFLGTSQQEQQWMVSRARAVEVGRSVVVSSVNGISGAIAPDGSVLARLPAGRAGSTTVTVPVRSGTTPAVLLGPWPARAAYVVTALAVLAAVLPRRQRARNRPSQRGTRAA